MVGTGLEAALARLRSARGVAENVAEWCELPPQPPEYAGPPASLDARLLAWLEGQGVRLYRHQAEAVALALNGCDVIVATPTASGKSLCYLLPVLQALLTDPEARALYLAPTKALAHDQMAAMHESFEALGLGAAVAAYDGDTPASRRAAVRERARVVVTNPDMLHVGILPRHVRWAEFLRGLRYVVVDEVHEYRGVFGSHVANVLRRLRRLCAFHGSAPTYLACSATIANPQELAERLLERPVRLVERNGAPCGPRTVILYNPPVVDAALGLRRVPQEEARALANLFLDADVQTVVFVRSRLGAELLLDALRQDAARRRRDPAAIRAYRSGYLAAERRAIERGLRDGSVRCVVATNALELGVDIGGLTAAILVGYPGSIASTRQQMGRAGRGKEAAAAVLVADASPVDQYVVRHPEYLLGRSPEHARINADNLHVLVGHLSCAAAELPFEVGERFGAETLEVLLGYLEQRGQVRRAGERWLYAAKGEPAARVSLRTSEPARVTILAVSEGAREETVGEIERMGAGRLLHEGAVYLHQGRQYLVESLDLERGVARTRPVQVDYYTQSSESTRIAIERVLEERAQPQADLAAGEVAISSRVTGYRRRRLRTHEHLGWGEVDLPEEQMVTQAAWLMLQDELVDRLRDEGLWVGNGGGGRGPSWPQQRERARRRDGYRCRWCGAEERPGRQHHVHHLVPFREYGWAPGANENDRLANRLENLVTLCPACHQLAEQRLAVQGTLAGLARVMGHLLPLHLMCDAADLGLHCEARAPQTGRATVFVYDRAPGGAGLSVQLLPLYDAVLARSEEVVCRCPCARGCPACVGPPTGGDETAKERVLRLARSLQAASVGMS